MPIVTGTLLFLFAMFPGSSKSTIILLFFIGISWCSLPHVSSHDVLFLELIKLVNIMIFDD